MKSDSPITIRSSEDFAQGLFKPHGRVQMWVEGQVVYMVAQGPFNPEFVRALALAREELFRSSPPPSPHLSLVQIKGSIMASPEMLAVYAELIGKLKRLPVAVAWAVDPEVEGRDFILPMFERVHLRLGRNFKSFEALADAEAWLRSQLPDLPAS